MRLNFFFLCGIIKVYEAITDMDVQPFTNFFSTVKLVLRDLTCV